MSRPFKLLLDECLGRPLIDSVAQLLSWDDSRPEIRHLLDFFQEGTCDSEWIPKVAEDGWIILTADRAKKSRHAKLPDICHKYKITHILMSAAVLKLKQNQKANAIVAVWEQVKLCGDAPPGTRFQLKLTSSKTPTIKKLS